MIEDSDVVFVDFDELFGSANPRSHPGPYSPDSRMKEQPRTVYNYHPYPYHPPGYPHSSHHPAHYYPQNIHYSPPAVSHPSHPAMFYPMGNMVNPSPYVADYYPVLETRDHQIMVPVFYNSHMTLATNATTANMMHNEESKMARSAVTEGTHISVAATTLPVDNIIPNSNKKQRPEAIPTPADQQLASSISARGHQSLLHTDRSSTTKQPFNPQELELGAAPSEENVPLGNDSGKLITKEQYYKIRPKVPRICKNDPRRLYATAFSDAYNSCDFDKIWEFMSTYCTKDVLMINRWVGAEVYLNFPKYLEVKGTESVAEYWFGRCLVAPDLVLELKETKLYVRSDGISTVLSSFSGVSTRLYDGEISDSIFCRSAVDADLRNEQHHELSQYGRNREDIYRGSESEGDIPKSRQTSGDSSSVGSNSNPEDIYNRVLKKMYGILCQVQPPQKRRTAYKRKIGGESSVDPNTNLDITYQDNHMTSLPSTSARKRLPQDTSVFLVGTITLHLNKDNKIRQIDLSFALQDR